MRMSECLAFAKDIISELEQHDIFDSFNFIDRFFVVENLLQLGRTGKAASQLLYPDL
jgi:hypothetical protein